MRKINFIIVLIYSITTTCISCKDRQETIYENVNITKFQTIAQKNKKYYCLILIDPASRDHEKYQTFLKKNKKLLDKALFNFIDINKQENKWLEQWLSPITIPVTCVFNPSGKLINLINGCTYESTSLLIENVIKEKNTDGYVYPNRFKLAKQDILSVMGEILICKLKLDNQKNIHDDILETLDILKYPYNLSLKLASERREKLDSSAIKTCEEILSLKDAYNVILFRDLFILAEQVIDSGYSIKNAQNIEIISDSINLGECKQGEIISFNVNVKNNGYHPLTIYEIYSGCGCLKYVGNNNIIQIPPQKTAKIPFKLVPDVTGEIFRIAYFISDSWNNNLKEIRIYTSVK